MLNKVFETKLMWKFFLGYKPGWCHENVSEMAEQFKFKWKKLN